MGTNLRSQLLFWFWPTVTSLVVVLAVWLIAIGPMGVESWVLASPQHSVRAILDFPQYYWPNFLGTLSIIIFSVPLSLVIGAGLGSMAVLYPKSSNSIWAGLVLAQALPIFALGPVVAVLVGNSLIKSVFVSLLILVFPVALGLYRGIKNIDRDLVDAGRLDARNHYTLLFSVLWPLSLPSLMGGLRSAMTIAPMAAFIGELAGTQLGLSRIIAREMSLGRTEFVWGAVVLMVLMALVLFGVGALLERLIVPWSFIVVEETS